VTLRAHGSLITTVLVGGMLCVPGLSSPLAAQGAATDAPSIGAVFREVPRDLWRFVSLDTAVVLAAGGGAAAIAHVWDDDFVRQLEVFPRLNSALEPGSKYGAFAVMLGGSFAVYGAGHMIGHPKLAVVGADLVRGQIVSPRWVLPEPGRSC
jgi:hypothetical protein